MDITENLNCTSITAQHSTKIFHLIIMELIDKEMEGSKAWFVFTWTKAFLVDATCSDGDKWHWSRVLTMKVLTAMARAMCVAIILICFEAPSDTVFLWNFPWVILTFQVAKLLKCKVPSPKYLSHYKVHIHSINSWNCTLLWPLCINKPFTAKWYFSVRAKIAFRTQFVRFAFMS